MCCDTQHNDTQHNWLIYYTQHNSPECCYAGGGDMLLLC